MFHNVCLQPSPDRKQLTAWLLGAHSSKQSTQQNIALLQQHLQHVLQGEYRKGRIKVAAAELPVNLPEASNSILASGRTTGIAGSSGDAFVTAVSMARTFAIRDNMHSEAHTRTRLASTAGAFNTSAFEAEPRVTLLWTTWKTENRYSFGHCELALLAACLSAMQAACW
jgi:hypothetical protein